MIRGVRAIAVPALWLEGAEFRVRLFAQEDARSGQTLKLKGSSRQPEAQTL